MKDYVNIGPVPCERIVRKLAGKGTESKRFIELLRKTFGDKPDGARLTIKWFDHDFGSYCEVVCWYETQDEKARAYAFRCENEMPLTWEGGRREQLKFSSG